MIRRGTTLAIAAAALALAGCTSSGGFFGIFRPGHGEAAASDRADATANQAQDAENAARAAVLKTAQADTALAAELLEAAPPSRPVDTAGARLEAANAGLAQALGPLPAAQDAALRDLAARLLSENQAIRDQADAQIADRARELAAVSLRLEAATAAKAAAELERDAARRELREAFDRENETANKYRAAQLQKYAGFALSGILAAAGLWLRFASAGQLATLQGTLKTVVSGVDKFKTSAPPDQVSRLEQTLSALMDRAEKETIRRTRDT